MIKKREGSFLEHNVVRIKVEQLFIRKKFKEYICTVRITLMLNQVQILSKRNKI